MGIEGAASPDMKAVDKQQNAFGSPLVKHGLHAGRM